MGKRPVFQCRSGEQVFAAKVPGDTWKNPHYRYSRRVSGKFYFTDRRIVFLSSGPVGASVYSWELDMRDIASVSTCLSPPCFPFGIQIETRDGREYLIAILIRKHYVEWIRSHISR